MSGWADDPLHFLNWFRIHHPEVTADDFVPRCWYRTYLLELLSSAQNQAAPGVTLQWHADRVLDLLVNPSSRLPITSGHQARAIGDGITISTGLDDRLVMHLFLQQQSPIRCDVLVLAWGLFAPRWPAALADFADHPRLMANPWKTSYTQQISPKDDLLMIGSGLTALDQLFTLQSAGHHGSITLLSRHGLTPLPHTSKPLPHLPLEPVDCTTPHRAWKQVRRWIRRYRTTHDWRQIIDGLRPHTSQIWQHWSIAQREQFLRHGRAYWDVLRHRVAEPLHNRFQSMLTSGQLRIVSGHLLRVDWHEEPAQWLVHYRPRHQTSSRIINTHWIMNCTGPSSDYHQQNEPLLQALHRRELIASDPLNLGLPSDANGRVLNRQLRAELPIYTLGPPRRADLWESIAVPEIRQQAKQLAMDINAYLLISR